MEQKREEIIEKTNELSLLIRQLEEWAKKIDIDIKNDKIYIALKAYKKALIGLI